MKRVVPAAGCLVVLLILASTSGAARAWPRLMMFYGTAIQNERRHITDWHKVEEFFDALESSNRARPDGPFLEVALYWHGPTWEPFVTDPAKLKDLPLPPNPAGSPTISRPAFIQSARLYLGNGSQPPIFDYFSADRYPGLQVVNAQGVKLLAAHGIPTDVREIRR
jgi:hypothetical protein